ncbi:jg16763 [Pararge aegeria aegeria]|uniref:Jg16763 protein n=1 Tax=Pararge aegeria aegeria TaxID=348720 RepID=A0A8S4R8F2_9NEOP|nr:jg16763 [Pararge aegeria aegeria]
MVVDKPLDPGETITISQYDSQCPQTAQPSSSRKPVGEYKTVESNLKKLISDPTLASPSIQSQYIHPSLSEAPKNIYNINNKTFHGNFNSFFYCSYRRTDRTDRKRSGGLVTVVGLFGTVLKIRDKEDSQRRVGTALQPISGRDEKDAPTSDRPSPTKIALIARLSPTSSVPVYLGVPNFWYSGDKLCRGYT